MTTHRNHAAFWDGKNLRLTPAYDVCPQLRTGDEAGQGMLIKGNENRKSIGIVSEICAAIPTH